MLKITKGLKKKKKGKKNKHKEDELFDSAELEEYRRQQQQKQEEGGDEEKSEASEEWLKFKALTSGVDDILKKTQGDLDRIKSTSFFQKKPPGPSETNKEVKPARPEPPIKGKWVDFDEIRGISDEPEEEPKEEVETEKVNEIVEEDEEESEFEEDQDDIFDTSFVDIVASGEVKLAYVPDSPIEEESGPDPFDTSIVDKVIKVDPKEKKRNLVNLGSAVEVLTGKLDKSPLHGTRQIKPKSKVQDLLLGSFDDGDGNLNITGEAEPAPKTILDDDPVFEEETSAILGLPPVTPLAEHKPIVRIEQENKTKGEQSLLKSLVEEFVPSIESEKQGGFDELDDEFEALAAESLSKKNPSPKFEIDDDLKDLGFEEGVDPFDTSFAAEILPGKLELKIIEKEILESNISVNIGSVEEKINSVLKNSELSAPCSQSDKVNLEVEVKQNIKRTDLLGGSTTDLSNIDQHPIIPKSVGETSEILQNPDTDPFDTSIAEVAIAPGKTELKYLEKELLDASQTEVQIELDNEFDPRADEKPIKLPNRPDNLPVGKRTSVPKVVAFDVEFQSENADLLAVGQDESSKVGKPLTPYYPPQQSIETVKSFEENIDPFDTSFVSNCPGKLELKILEKELAESDSKLKQSLSDPDFNPRQSEDKIQPNIRISKQEDILTSEVNINIKLHTPVTPKKFVQEPDKTDDIDPFDTSIASDLAPGKAEIKVLESELIHKQELPPVSLSSSSILEKLKRDSDSASRTPSVADVLEQPPEDITVKPLTPLTVGSSFEQDDIDPFDTSNIGDILPGKTEIKILESELMLN